MVSKREQLGGGGDRKKKGKKNTHSATEFNERIAEIRNFQWQQSHEQAVMDYSLGGV